MSPSSVTELLARHIESDSGLYYEEMFSRLYFEVDGAEMWARGGGPVLSGLQLRKAVTELDTDGDFQPNFDADNYGTHITVRRRGDRAIVYRATERPRGTKTENGWQRFIGPEEEIERLPEQDRYEGLRHIESRWDDFVEAVNGYWTWVLTELPQDAEWYMESERFQGWRREAGVT